MQISVQQTQVLSLSEPHAVLGTPAVMPTPNVQEHPQSVSALVDLLLLAESAVSVFNIVK